MWGMLPNGLAKLRGRVKRVELSNRQGSKPSKLLYNLTSTIELACWCFLIELNFQVAHQRP
jgi:hypothetical protein